MHTWNGGYQRGRECRSTRRVEVKFNIMKQRKCFGGELTIENVGVVYMQVHTSNLYNVINQCYPLTFNFKT